MYLGCDDLIRSTEGLVLSISSFPSTLPSMLTQSYFVSKWCYITVRIHTHTHTHIPQLNSTTVVVRSSLGSPLISPCVCFHGQLCMQSQFLIWQRTPGPRVTINFTFNCQQVLITGITAALNVRFLLIFLPVKKVNRPKEINIARTPQQKYPLEFTISFSSLANMAQKSKRGKE